MGADLNLHEVTSGGNEIPVDINLSPMQLNGELNITAVVRESGDA